MESGVLILLAAVIETDEPLAGAGSGVFPFSAAGGLPAILIIAPMSGLATVSGVFLVRKRPRRKRTVDRKRRPRQPSPLPELTAETMANEAPRRRQFRVPSYAAERQ